MLQNIISSFAIRYEFMLGILLPSLALFNIGIVWPIQT